MSNTNLQDDKKGLLSRSTNSTEIEGYTYELRDRRTYKNRYWHVLHLFVLYTLVIGTSAALVIMSYKMKDPTLAVYCAFSDVIHLTVRFAEILTACSSCRVGYLIQDNHPHLY